MVKQKSFSFIFRVALALAVGCFIATSVGAADVERQTLELKLGGSDLLKTSHPFTRISIADPGVADVVVLSPKEIYIFGKKVGYTSMILWEAGKGKTLVDVVVELDLTALKKKLHELYPNQQIEVYPSQTGVVLTGTVSGPEIVEQVLRLTQTFLPKEASGKGSGDNVGKSGKGITNLLTVGSVQQVMLEVKIAEVTRGSGRDWQAAMGLINQGNDLKAVTGVAPLGVKSDGTLGVAQQGSLLLNFAENAANIFINIDNFTAALQFLEDENLARTLAEPRLVTQSGQEASFLAGGEFPIQVIDDNGNIGIEFKDFGVGLQFTPLVLSDGKISMRVAPSVTDISELVPTSTGPVPVFETRQLQSTVQMYDGQTLALAGLLKDNLVEAVNKIPGLGDLPVLGALFRSSTFQHDKTDLLIAVTPHLVAPLKEGSIEFPGEKIKIPNRLEFYLEGRMEGRRSPDEVASFSRHEFTPSPQKAEAAGGLEGEFGQEPVKQ